MRSTFFELGYGWLNVGSLLLGLLALAAPVLAVLNRRRGWNLASMVCCALALYCQIQYTTHLVRIEDITALLDTQTFMAGASGALLVLTLAANAVSLTVQRATDRRSTR